MILSQNIEQLTAEEECLKENYRYIVLKSSFISRKNQVN
jgi:hypothetical protein